MKLDVTVVRLVAASDDLLADGTIDEGSFQAVEVFGHD